MPAYLRSDRERIQNSSSPTHVFLMLTKTEAAWLEACLSGELDNRDETSDSYMNALARVSRKLTQAKRVERKGHVC